MIYNTTLQAVSITDFINKEIKHKDKKFSNLTSSNFWRN